MVVSSAKGKDLGTKRVCASCGSKFYDFGKADPTCPRCGTLFDVNAAPAPAVRHDPPAPATPDDEEVRRSRLLAGLDDEELEIAGKVEDDDDVDFGDDDDDTESYDEGDDDGDDKDSDGGDDW